MTTTVLKSISKLILYAGAVACCLAGVGGLFLLIGISNMLRADYRPFSLAWTAIIYLCLAFMPASMLLKGFRTKAWHWVSIAVAEVIVLAVALYVLIALYMLATTGFGE